MSFITGSRAYGTPMADSDIDLVVRVTSEEFTALNQLADSGLGESLRFGRLNLILCTEDDKYAAWWRGTRDLVAEKPVSREVAIEKFKALFSALPMDINYG